MGSDVDNVIELFVQGAHVVADALADPDVASNWNRPSVLAEQDVASLAGHLARGGVWVVADYLDEGEPEGPVTFESAGEYFATLVGKLSEAANRAIRDRGAAVAAVGHAALVMALADRLGDLERRLAACEPQQLIAVAAGSVMRLEDYLVTRIVEQTVHLDDLARSIDREPWPVAAAAERLTITTGVEVGRRRRGAPAMIRALYRSGCATPTLPVM